MRLTVQELYSATPEEIKAHWRTFGYDDDKDDCMLCLRGRLAALNALFFAIITAVVGAGWFMVIGAFVTVFGLSYMLLAVVDATKTRRREEENHE